MPNLPENTQYGTSGTQPLANFSSIMKMLQQKTPQVASNTTNSAITSHFNPTPPQNPTVTPQVPAQQPTSPTVSSIINNFDPNVAESIFTPAPTSPTGSALLNHFDPTVAQNLFDLPTPVQNPTSPTFTPPIDKPFDPVADNLKQSNLPEGYLTSGHFMAPDKNNNWGTPSDQTYLQNFPTSLGGGQLAVDPTQKNIMMKSNREIMDSKLNPGALQSVLGGLSSRFYQVDHIVPLWIGGADTLQNLQVLDLPTHERKTAVQAVPLTLLANGKIDLAQAKLMALTWNEKDASGIPTPDNNGYVPLKTAEAVAQKWQDGPSTWDSIKKYFGQSFTENMQNFGKGWLPDPIREFAKGLVGGGTAGIVSGTGASPDEGAAGKVSNFAGNLVGSLTGIGLVGKGLGAIGLLGSEAKAGSSLLQYTGTGIKSLDSLLGTTGAAKTVAGITDAANLTDSVMKETGLITDMGNLTPKFIASSVRGEKMARMASSALVLSTWGQLGLTGKNLTGQEKFDLGNNIRTAVTDIAYGGLLGASGQNIKGYAWVGLASTAIPLIEGQDIIPALQNGVLMTALHTMGYERGALDPKTRIASDEAFKMSANVFDQYGKGEIPTVKKGQSVPQVLQLDPATIDKLKSDYKQTHPNDTRFDSVSNTDSAGAVQIMGRNARSQFMDSVVNGNGRTSQADIKAELTRITVAENQLSNHTLPVEERAQKEMADLLSMGEKLRPQVKPSQLTSAKDSNEIFNKVNFSNLDESITNTSGAEPAISGLFTVVGYGENLGTQEFKTVNDIAKNPKNFKPYVVGTIDDETIAAMKAIQQAEIEKTGKSSIVDPESTVQFFALEIGPDGKVSPRAIGYMPQEVSYTKTLGVNKTYQEITDRLFETLNQSKSSPEEILKNINKDKSQPNLTPEGASELYDLMKSKTPISEETLYSLLKPSYGHEKYDSSLNNVSVASEMTKNKSNFVIADINKAWMSGGRENMGDPRSNTKNPFIELNFSGDRWAQGQDLNSQKNIPTPIQQGVRNIVSNQNAQNISDIAGEIRNRVSPDNAPVASSAGSETPSAMIPIEENTPTAPTVIPKLTAKEIRDLKKQGFSDAMIQKMMTSGTITGNSPTRNTSYKVTSPVETTQTSLPLTETPPTEPVITPKTSVETPEITKTTTLTTEVKPTQKTGLIQDLVNRSKITAEEAAPYIAKEEKINKLSNAASNRYLKPSEQRQIHDMGRDIRTFLESKGLVKPVESRWTPISTESKNSNTNDLLKSALLHADGEMDSLKGEFLGKSPEVMTKALRGVANKSIAIINENKLKLNPTEQRELRNVFNDNVNNMIQDRVDQAFQGNINLSGVRYEERPRMEGEPKKTIFADQKLANDWGLKLDDKGYLALDKNKQPTFSPEFSKKFNIKEGTNPTDWYKEKGKTLGDIFKKSLDANFSSKTLNSRSYLAGIDKASQSEDFGPLFKGLRKIIDMTVSDYKEPLKDSNIDARLHNTKKVPSEGNWKLNSMFSGKSPYMQKLFSTTNAQGSDISQPKERIFAKGEDQLKTIDEKTKEIEDKAKEAKINRDAQVSGEGDTSATGDLPVGVGKEDLQNTSQQDVSQMEKIHDLTKMESLFSSMQYQELTGKKPPLKMLVDDAIKSGKDFIAGYNASIKPEGKTQKAYVSKDGWKKIRDYLNESFKKEFPGGKGGPYDGQGGPLNNLTNAVNKRSMGHIEIIARHGSTDSNGGNVFRGWAETKLNQLSQKGKEDAKKLGHSIKKLVGDKADDYVIVASDLNRAMETAITVSKISGVPLGKYYSDLRSQDTGDFSGKKESEVKDKIEHNIKNEPNKPLPGASESHTEFLKRIQTILKPNGEIEKDYPNKKIIVVTHHQVEVLHANNFNKATDSMFSNGIEPGTFRKAKKTYDGKGGPFDAIGNLGTSLWGGIKDVLTNSNTTTYKAPQKMNGSTTPSTSIAKPTTYNFRGLQVTDNDLDEASKIIGLEISNRPNKDKFETENILNTAINRALTGPKQWGSTLTDVLQKPAQFQSYAPNGMLDKQGNATTSNYQKLQQGTLGKGDLDKIKKIRAYLDGYKTTPLVDTTKGSTFYSHASDGTMWIGKTPKEVSDLVNIHEKNIKSSITPNKTSLGFPIASNQ